MVADGTASRRGVDEDAEREASEASSPPTGAAAVAVGQRVRELVEFGSYYVAAQTDRVKLVVINSAMFVVLGLIGACLGLVILATAAALFVVGIADAIGTLLWHQMWAGYLITSVVIIGGLIVGTIVVFKKVTKSSRERLVAAYEQRKSKQRSTLGTDVEEQSHR